MPGSWANAKTTIQCVENGPYMVKGPVVLKGDRGEPIETMAVMALCRCGGSKSKPFCDGTHSRIGFRSDMGARP
jgi:CDGSH-type Zn-finger protein